MAEKFVHVDRVTPLLLPPSIQEWVPDDHPARLTVELVDQLDLTAAATNQTGSGSAQYPPSMMLSLLIYSYSSGIFTSRRIETLCYNDIGARLICAGYFPDHDTINTFRKNNRSLFHRSFIEILRLAAELELVNLGKLEIASDGTTLRSAGGSKQSRTRQQISEDLKKADASIQAIETQIDELFAQADRCEKADPTPDRTLPEGLETTAKRQAKIQAAKKELARQQALRTKLQTAQDIDQAALDQAQATREQRHKDVKASAIGIPPKPTTKADPQARRVNLHDPHAPSLKLKNGQYGHGYNVQMSVDTAKLGLIVGAHITTEGNDRQQLSACVAQVEATLGPGTVAAVLADSGYDNTYQIDLLEKRGIDVQCELQGIDKLQKGPSKNTRGTRVRATFQRRQEHYEKISTEANRQRRRRRRETIEPRFGEIKSVMGFDRFHLCGERGVDLELVLVSTAANVRKLNANATWQRAMKAKRVKTGGSHPASTYFN